MLMITHGNGLITTSRMPHAMPTMMSQGSIAKWTYPQLKSLASPRRSESFRGLEVDVALSRTCGRFWSARSSDARARVLAFAAVVPVRI
jgi:hypothetical protein